MKYIYIGAGILAVLLMACILSGILIFNYTQDVVQTLETALNAFDDGDFPAARELAGQAHSKWQEHEKFLTALLSHVEVHEVESTFSALLSYGETDTEDEFRCNCQILLSHLQHISEMDIPYLHNFFVQTLHYEIKRV